MAYTDEHIFIVGIVMIISTMQDYLTKPHLKFLEDKKTQGNLLIKILVPNFNFTRPHNIL